MGRFRAESRMEMDREGSKDRYAANCSGEIGWWELEFEMWA